MCLRIIFEQSFSRGICLEGQERDHTRVFAVLLQQIKFERIYFAGKIWLSTFPRGLFQKVLGIVLDTLSKEVLEACYFMSNSEAVSFKIYEKTIQEPDLWLCSGKRSHRICAKKITNNCVHQRQRLRNFELKVNF